MKLLWALFIVGQVLSAGNMNWQQENGYYEINSVPYGEHPSRERVYLVKTIETGLIWGATKVFPKHEKKILAGSNLICWGFIVSDRVNGIAFKVRF